MSWKKVSWGGMPTGTGIRGTEKPSPQNGANAESLQKKWPFGRDGVDPWSDIPHIEPQDKISDEELKVLVEMWTKDPGLQAPTPSKELTRAVDRIVPGSAKNSSRWKRVADANGTPYTDTWRAPSPGGFESPPAPTETDVPNSVWPHAGDNGLEIYPTPWDDPKLMKDIIMGYQGLRFEIPKGPRDINKIGQILPQQENEQDQSRKQDPIPPLVLHMIKNHYMDQEEAIELFQAGELKEVHLTEHIDGDIETHNSEVLRVAKLAADSRKKRLFQRDKSLEENGNNTTVLHTRDNGDSIVKLNEQGDYNYESDMQGNCVRHYGPNPTQDEEAAGHDAGHMNNIHSLRDKDNIPVLSFTLSHGETCGNCHGRGSTSYEDECSTCSGTGADPRGAQNVVSLTQVQGREDAEPDDNETIRLLHSLKEYGKKNGIQHVSIDGGAKFNLEDTDALEQKVKDAHTNLPQTMYLRVRGARDEDGGINVMHRNVWMSENEPETTSETESIFKTPLSKKRFNVSSGLIGRLRNRDGNHIDGIDVNPTVDLKPEAVFPKNALEPVKEFKFPTEIYVKTPARLRDNPIHFSPEGLVPHHTNVDTSLSGHIDELTGDIKPKGHPPSDSVKGANSANDVWKVSFDSEEEARQYISMGDYGGSGLHLNKRGYDPNKDEWSRQDLVKPLPWNKVSLVGQSSSPHVPDMPKITKDGIEHKDHPEYVYHEVNIGNDVNRIHRILHEGLSESDANPRNSYGLRSHSYMDNPDSSILLKIKFDRNYITEEKAKAGQGQGYKIREGETFQVGENEKQLERMIPRSNYQIFKATPNGEDIPIASGNRNFDISQQLVPLNEQDVKDLSPSHAYLHIPVSSRHNQYIYTEHGVSADSKNTSIKLQPNPPIDFSKYVNSQENDFSGDRSDIFKVDLRKLPEGFRLSDPRHDRKYGESNDDALQRRSIHPPDTGYGSSYTKTIPWEALTLHSKGDPMAVTHLQNFLNKQRKANILDPILDTLDPEVFDNPASDNPTLKNTIRNWVVAKVYQVMQSNGLENPEKWLRLILTGSLTTYQWAPNSDFDISLWVDIDEMTDFDRAIFVKLVVTQLDGQVVPGTTHPLQCFVVNVEQIREMREIYDPEVRSAWSIDDNKWIVAPNKKRVHNIRNEYPDVYHKGLNSLAKMKSLVKYQPEAAEQYWNYIHKRRRDDMKAGRGDFADSNVAYKMIANAGMFSDLEKITGEHIAHNSFEDGPVTYHNLRLLKNDTYIEPKFGSLEEYEVEKLTPQEGELGFISWWDEGEEAETEEVHVHPDYRRKGIASILLTTARTISPNLTSSQYRTGDGNELLKSSNIDREDYQIVNIEPRYSKEMKPGTNPHHIHDSLFPFDNDKNKNFRQDNEEPKTVVPSQALVPIPTGKEPSSNPLSNKERAEVVKSWHDNNGPRVNAETFDPNKRKYVEEIDAINTCGRCGFAVQPTDPVDTNGIVLCEYCRAVDAGRKRVRQYTKWWEKGHKPDNYSTQHIVQDGWKKVDVPENWQESRAQET